METFEKDPEEDKTLKEITIMASSEDKQQQEEEQSVKRDYGLRKTSVSQENGSRVSKNRKKRNIKQDGVKIGGYSSNLEMGSVNDLENDENGLSGLMTLCEKAVSMEGEVSESEAKDSEGEELCYNVYSVGDFVWGKIKHHPWWPGQVYDPSDASDFALKIKQKDRKDRYLVAYFGDGTFSWCHGSQLKPFEENFEQFSKESNAKGFVNAVEAAIETIGKLVELKMTCSCVPGDNEVGVVRPVAGNAGIKEGVIVPEGGLDKLSIAQFEPAKLVARLSYFGQEISNANFLQFTVLKSTLTAFYRAKGYYPLPMYHFPQYIVGLEDRKKGATEEDRDSLMGLSLQNRPEISDGKLYHRRKQKSIAEILSRETDAELKKDKEEVDLSKSVSVHRMKKKVVDEGETHDDVKLISLARGRKKAKSSQGIVITDSDPSAGGDEKTDKSPVLGNGKGHGAPILDNDSGTVKEEIMRASSPRERKKSKYLSPPFTIPKRGGRDTELEFLKMVSSDDSHVGERLSKAADQILGSPSAEKCNDETHENKSDKASGIKNDKPDISKYSEPTVAKVNVNEVLSEIQSAALGLQPKSPGGNEEFFSTFRDSVYQNGSNNKMYDKRRPGRKRKSFDPESGSLGKGLNQTDHISPEIKTQETKINKTDERPDTPKLKQKSTESGPKQADSKPRGKRIKKNEAKQDNRSPKSKSQKARAKKNEEKPGTPKAKEISIVSGGKQAESKPQQKTIKKRGTKQESHSPEGKSKKKKIKQNEEKPGTPKAKQTSAVSGGKEAGTKFRGKRIKKDEIKQEIRKHKQAAGSLVKEKKGKSSDDGKALTAALTLTFQSGVPLPSKSNLMADYSKFGLLNEEKTEILYNAFHARVVFVRKSDGEQAFQHLTKMDSRDSGITYGLQYMPSGSKSSDANQPEENDKSPENSSVQYFKQKFEMLTSMVEKSEGNMSQEMKTNLESEMMSLLEKLRNMS